MLAFFALPLSFCLTFMVIYYSLETFDLLSIMTLPLLTLMSERTDLATT
jgi:hypothetical protein